MFNDIERFAEKPALIDTDGTTLSYADITSLGQNISSGMQERSLVLAICKNHFDSIIGYISFLRAGHTQILVEDKINVEFLKKILQTYQPRYIFAPADKELNLENYTIIANFKKSALYQSIQDVPLKLHPNLALLLSTSGSTGSPKMVKITYENLKSNASSISKYLDINAQDTAITTMPMAYSYGLSIINTHLLTGAKIIVTDSPITAKTFWEAFKRFNGTSLSGVPFFYEALSKLRFNRMQLPSLRYLTQAGGKLSSELILEFKSYCLQNNLHFYVMYGQTEATARIAYNCTTAHPSEEKNGSIGQAIPHGKLWLEDDNGNPVSLPNTLGELIYSGPNVSMGYAETICDLGSNDDFKGILRTGDIATVDQDGYVFIVGRKKNFLKIFGNRINLADVEEFVRNQSEDVACSGEDNNLKVYVVGVKEPEELRILISHTYGLPLRGIQVISIQQIPRNSAGKVLYSSLSDMHFSQTEKPKDTPRQIKFS